MNAGITGRDMHKIDKPEIAEMGGLPVLAGFLIGVFAYLAVQTYFFNSHYYNPLLFAGIMTIIFAGLIGTVDDILGKRLGLRQWQKPLFGLFAAVPLVVMNSGVTTMVLPIFGSVNLGLIYPIIIIPLIVSGEIGRAHV